MVFAESLGREINDYIKSLLNKEVTILDEQNKIVASNEKEVGTRVVLPDNVAELTSYKTIEIDGSSKTLIPLKYQSKNIAFLLLDENSTDIKNYAPLIKSFAELLIQQFFENNKPALDSTDQFIIKLFNNYNPSNEAEYEAEARVLGYDTSVKRVALSIHLKGFWDNCLLDFDQPSFERDQVIQNWKMLLSFPCLYL
jgi:sugar diacid utilization regulator